jgi:hypothetical protein
MAPGLTDQRFYASSYGRFLTPDRKRGTPGNPGSLNRYSYVLGDPVNRNDRHGTDSCVVGQGWTVDDEGNVIPDYYDDYWDYAPSICMFTPQCMQAVTGGDPLPGSGGGGSPYNAQITALVAPGTTPNELQALQAALNNAWAHIVSTSRFAVCTASNASKNSTRLIR